MNNAEKVSELKASLLEAGVEYCFATFVDINGVPKAKCVPITSFEKMCSGSELFTVGAMEGMGLIGPEKDECAAVPDLDSLIIFPWDKRYAWFASDLYYHGEPYQNCARVLLKKQIAKAAQLGFGMNLGVETEFYLLKKTEEGVERPQSHPHKGICPAYDVNQTMQSMDFLIPMVEAMNDLGWGVYSFDAEGGQGQYEFDFAYTDVLKMADRLAFWRFMVKTLAMEHGLIASFMPKPFSSDFRSGAHFNMSLYALETGDNLFMREDSRSGEMAKKYKITFPDIGYNFVGGLLRHADAITAVTCPTHNSYKGLVAQGEMNDMSWAPVLKTYGANNRSAMIRLPMNRPCVENRSPDISCNFYLGAAISLAAGLEGIEKQLDPGTPMNDNLYMRVGKPTAAVQFKTSQGLVQRLPRTLLEALQAFEEDPLVLDVFGEEFRDIYMVQKLKEWDRDFYRVDEPERDRMLEYV